MIITEVEKLGLAKNRTEWVTIIISYCSLYTLKKMYSNNNK